MTTMATRLPTRFKGTTEALQRAVVGSKPSKYRNQPVMHDGIRFASKAEGRRYLELKLLERAGKISGLEMQVAFKLEAFDKVICKYVADFRYYDNERGDGVVEDVKGMLTPEFKLKAKLFEANFGVPITIIKA